MLSPIARRWLNHSNLPKRFAGRTFDSLDKYADHDEVMSTVRDWVAAVGRGDIIAAETTSAGVGLAFIGKPGHGKTTLAAAVVNEIIALAPFVGRPTRPIYFAYYPELLDLSKKAFNDDEAQAVMDAILGRQPDPVQILVIDDLGKEHRTSSHWAENMFDHLLRQRYDRGLPTIITTNVALKDWGSAYGESMQSFAHEALTPLTIMNEGGDRRR